MTDKQFKLSAPERIKFVRDQLVLWMLNNNIEPHELRRAEAMLLRESDEQRKQEALERRTH